MGPIDGGNDAKTHVLAARTAWTPFAFCGGTAKACRALVEEALGAHVWCSCVDAYGSPTIDNHIVCRKGLLPQCPGSLPRLLTIGVEDLVVDIGRRWNRHLRCRHCCRIQAAVALSSARVLNEHRIGEWAAEEVACARGWR